MERRGDLLLDRCHIGLPSDPSDHRFAGDGVPHEVGAPGDPVAVGVVGVGGGEQIVLGDRLEQAHPDHLRGEAWRDHRVVPEITELQVDDLEGRGDEGVRRAIGVGALDHGERDVDGPFGGHAEDRAVLQLSAVHRMLGGRAGRRAPWYGQPQEQADGHGVAVRCRGDASPVQDVARRAGLGVEHRTKPVASVRRRRGGDPVLVEQAVADFERAPLVARQVRRREAERRPRRAVAGRLSAEVGVGFRWRVASGTGRGDQNGDPRGSSETPERSVRRGYLRSPG